MRAVLVCGRLAPELDGVADYATRLAARLAGHGVDVELVEAAGRRPVAALATRLRRERRAVVHVQYAPSAFAHAPSIGLLPQLLPRSVPLVTTLHEYGGNGRRPRLARLAPPLERRAVWDRETARLVPRSARVVVTNSGHARVVRARFAGRAEPQVLPVPPNVEPAEVDRAEQRRDVRARLGLAVDAPLLAFFGFVHPVKGVRYLLEALALLRAERPELHLVVAGGATSLALPEDEARAVVQELREHARRLGQEEAVSWTGYRPAHEVSAVLSAADAVVLPFPAGVTTKSGALAAAFAHGAPVVATAAEPPDPDLVDGREVALVRVVRDPVALAAGVRRVLADPELAARLRACGLQQAQQRSWERIAAEHVQLYQHLVPVAGRRA